jgi:hypothetical protein
MKKLVIGILCSAAATSIAAPAFAASDYLLVIDGVDGEASQAIEIQSWSWGASNPSAVTPNIGSSGQDGVARERPTVTASQNTQSLRESPTVASNGVKSPRDAASGQASGRSGVNVAAGDLDGDGRLDLDALAKVDEVSGFTMTLAPGDAARRVCGGKHIKEAHIVARGVVYDFEGLDVSCTGGGGAGGMTMSVTGKTKEFKGHVTLMK